MRRTSGDPGKGAAVGMLVVATNELPDCQVVQCVRSEFARIQFPAPEGGIVTVQYPIVLEPGD